MKECVGKSHTEKSEIYNLQVLMIIDAQLSQVSLNNSSKGGAFSLIANCEFSIEN